MEAKNANYSTAESLFPKTPTEDDYLNYLQNKLQKIQPVENLNLKVKPDLFIAADEKMVRIREIVEQIANANVPVLISGESGTGKEIVAKAIHGASMRSKEPFVAINCAALPTTLLENELFGHERGAYTDAHQRYIGKFEQANGGTLLLDEITEIDQTLQAKLLRVLQEKEIERIGGSGPIKVDTRIIATTNRDINAHVQQGAFRSDLFYRLYVIHLEIPPLRERIKDIEILSQYFLEKYSLEHQKNSLSFSSQAKDLLRSYNWPGNVRELQNVIQRTVIMVTKDVINAEDIPLEQKTAIEALDWVKVLPIGRPLKDLETQFILSTLKHHAGNRTHAAKTLGISLRTLRNKINEFTADGLQVTAPTLRGLNG